MQSDFLLCSKSPSRPCIGDNRVFRLRKPCPQNNRCKESGATAQRRETESCGSFSGVERVRICKRGYPLSRGNSRIPGLFLEIYRWAVSVFIKFATRRRGRLINANLMHSCYRTLQCATFTKFSTRALEQTPKQDDYFPKEFLGVCSSQRTHFWLFQVSPL